MARNIPQDRPLSGEDRAYLVVRGRTEIIERIDLEFPYPGSHGGMKEPGIQLRPNEDGIKGDLRVAPEEARDTDDRDRYDEWTVPRIKAELESRGLSPNGKKQELIERLREDDSNEWEDSDDSDGDTLDLE